MSSDPFRYVHASAAPVIWSLARQIYAMTRVPAPGVWIGRGWDPKSAEHGTGCALDVIVSDKVGIPADTAQRATGDLIGAWLIRHAAALRIRHIIWRRRIWRRRYAAAGWTALPNRDASSNPSDWHDDHLHIYLDDANGVVPNEPLRKETPAMAANRALTPEDVDAVVRTLLLWELPANGKKQALVQHLAEGFVADAAQSTALAKIASRLSAIGSDVAEVKKSLK